MKQEAKVFVRYEFTGEAQGEDGFAISFSMDDSLRSWWSIVRWNWHYHHWRALAMNVRHLFTRVLWRKLWRHSS